MATKSIPTIAEVKAIIEDELSKLNLGGDIDLGAIAESIIPAISASYNLGSSTKKFNNAYANHFYQNGQHCLSLDSISVNGAYSNTSSYVTINTGGSRNLMICFGATAARASVDSNYAVTFPKSFYGIPKTFMQMFKVSVGSNSLENAQYRNGQEISGFYGTSSSTNVTSSTGRVNGFKFIPGNGSSYYYSWIAIGYEY